MGTAKLVFFDWGTFYGKLIKFQTKSKWSHVGLIIEEDDGTYTIAEALNRGLVISKYGKLGLEQNIKDGKVMIKTISVNTTPANFKTIAEKYEGAPYDWFSIINIALYSFIGKIALNFKGPRALICSEFVARVLYESSNGRIDFKQEYNKPFDLITPAEIFRSRYLK